MALFLANFAIVAVVEAHPFVVTLGAYIVGSNATLNALVNPLGQNTTAWIEWGTSQAYGNSTTNTNLGPGEDSLLFTNTISGLRPGVVYHYRAVAVSGNLRCTGLDGTFVSPLITLIGAAALTNECHTSFTDPGVSSVTAVPLALAIGYDHGLAIKGDGTIAAWGDDSYGQVSGAAGISNAVQVSAGTGQGDFSLALLADGSVVGWGYNGSGELNIPTNLSNVVELDASSEGEFCIALTQAGTVAAWGAGQIYNPSDGIDFGQSMVPAGLSNIVSIAAGGFFGLALGNDGTVRGWGANDAGEIDIPLNVTNVVAISAGSFSAVALRRDGTVVTWGDDTFGQTEVPAGLNNVVAVAAGGFHCLALRRDGRVFAWGDDTYGELEVPVGLNNVVAITAGIGTSLALKADGTLVGWGDNSFQETTIPAGLTNLLANVNTSATFDPDSPGAYSIAYSTTNNLGSVGTATRNVQVVDTKRPIISLQGKALFSMLLGDTFIDPGATAFDLCAGDLTSQIVVLGQVDTNLPGIYPLVYQVTDPSGNTSGTNRTVIVLQGLATTQPATNITDVGATLNAFVFPGGIDTWVYFEWGTDTNYGDTTSPMFIPAATEVLPVSAGIAGLAAASTYHFRAVATNSLGVSWGVDQQFLVPILLHATLQSAGQIMVQFHGVLNAAYNIFSSYDLTLPLTNWTFRGQAIPSSSNTFYFQDNVAPEDPPRFYRITGL